MAGPEPDGLRAAVFLWRHARAWRDPGTDPVCTRAPQAAGGAERRRGGAVSRGGAALEDAGRAYDSLRGGAGSVRGGRAPEPPVRQWAAGDSGRAWLRRARTAWLTCP